ncbi:MAG: GTPase [Lachnospiraceae bacterium]|nr:GTPase [Lachnospiraceae bacterium]
MQEIPVYVFTGFMDSGKTSLIQETLFENNFGEGAKTLILCCEDGETEFHEEKLRTVNARVTMLEEQEDFNTERLTEIQKEYRPEQVFLEYNGTWDMSTLLETDLPEGWIIVQTLATVDAGTFELYLSNMRAMIMEQLFKADVVIFNRCEEDTPKGKFRRAVKAMNRPAQIVYERSDGTVDENDNEELPFDINQEIIDISDADYAIWYMDAQENPKKYDGKKVHFLALVYHPESMKKGMFVPGRFAMTCCVEDVQFLGYKCKYEASDEIAHKSWLDFTAEIRYEFAKEYRGKGPVLYPISCVPAEKPEDELVYFS